MESIISKELLSEVLDIYEVYYTYDINDDNAPEFNANNEIAFEYFGTQKDIDIDEDYMCSSNMQDMVLNIYELAHKCKEWAYSNNFIIVTLPYFSLKWSWKLHGDDISDDIDYDTEPEAIFKACQWILDNKDATNGRA